MGRNINTMLMYGTGNPAATSFSVPATASINVDVYLSDTAPNAKGILEVTYPTTSGTTGIAASTFNGIGPADPSINQFLPIPAVLGTAGATPGNGTNVAVFSNNAQALNLVSVTPSASASQTVRTSFNFADASGQTASWSRLQIKNLDASVAPTIKVYVYIP